MRVLVVDDEASIREFLDLFLSKLGYRVFQASNVAQARSLLETEDIALVLSDMRIGSESGMTVLKHARQSSSSPEVVLITAFGSPATAVEAMRAGAYDYLCKPFDNDELEQLVAKAIEKRNLRRENQQLVSSLSGAGSFWIGHSAAMQQVWSLVEKVAASKSTVLVVGESGTGKEVVARAIHLKSARAAKPFLPVNCAALNEGVLESELFGHTKGSFTGAHTDRVGILAAAGEGTVFLDEIGEIPASLQSKLLRVIQERRVKPVGSTAEVPFEARILAATNKRLEEEVRAGRFREDLFYRLNVITLALPPLRERTSDIAVLATSFLARLAEELGRPNLRLRDDTLEVLRRYEFPGNVRQLQNIVERAATLSDSDQLGPETLPPALLGRGGSASDTAEIALPERFALEQHLDEIERRHLLAALKQANGVKSRAAELLGLTFRSMRYRLAKHGLTAKDDA